ncbi:kinase-like protein [Laetiporus sulphureus 93-53]|uniref:Kinase-like protein n=1 Tax=Laetiporus sulphureus 93-53 TaxID=1314785 RepID=A0A165F231_9APHY|nr:kinase-like protein [Laetiporus sulphureus 93-53]KZT08211.1 kinase-like protein [Laetiporus sulphureus 93-53]
MHRRLLGKLKLPALTKRKARPAWPEEPLDLGTDANAGFFPAQLGTVLHSSYTVVRKLGFGQHSSVWMANDSRAQCGVAIKILTAHATLMQGSVACELPILRLVAKAQGHSDTETHLIKFKDTFNVQSCHGEHLCLVTEVLGSSFKAFCVHLEAKFPFPSQRRSHISFSLLRGTCMLLVLSIQAVPDIKFDNMLAVIDDIESFLSHQAKSSPPQIETLDVSAFPVPPVISQPLSTARDLSDNCSIPIFKLTDFGTSAFVDGYHSDIIQPVALRAPEVVIGCGWDKKADIWSVGCLVFEMLTGNWLFNPRPVGSWSADA